MRRTSAAAVASVVAVVGALGGQLLAAGAQGAPAAAPQGAVTSVGPAAAELGSRLRLERRLAREPVRRRDEDTSVQAIEHVTELQHRLRRAHVYDGRITGYFGRATEAAVSAFQRRADLRVTGVATGATWRVLLPRTIGNPDALPRRCTSRPGWHACYDRARHQVTLWRGGSLWNTWLVRGGNRLHKTRLGDFRVFYRDKRHVSSIYGTAMPYSQFFDGGEAFHGSPSMLDPYRGHSHGCVTMYIEDARQLWRLTHDVNLRVHVYGHWS